MNQTTLVLEYPNIKKMYNDRLFESKSLKDWPTISLGFSLAQPIKLSFT